MHRSLHQAQPHFTSGYVLEGSERSTATNDITVTSGDWRDIAVDATEPIVAPSASRRRSWAATGCRVVTPTRQDQVRDGL